MTSRIHESPTTLARVTELHDKVRSLITSTAKGVAALVAQKLFGAEPHAAQYGPSHGKNPSSACGTPHQMGRW